MLKNLLLAAVAAGVWLCPLTAVAQERSAVRPGFAFPTDHPVSIVVFRPDVTVGSLSTGGVSEPNADWTASARKLIADAMRAHASIAGARLVFRDEDPTGDDGAYLAEYRSLFKAVALAIQTNRLFVGARLPTKRDKFDWSLGDGTARIGRMTSADYALFFYTQDQYGTAGRKTAQIFGALMGVAIVPGIHIGYAGLVDLKTGDVIWLNADPQMGGDVRTPEGATKRVGQLLDGFPGMAPVALAATAPAAK